MSALVIIFSVLLLHGLGLISPCSIKRKIAHLCVPGGEGDWGPPRQKQPAASPMATTASLPMPSPSSAVDTSRGAEAGLTDVQSGTEDLNFFGMLIFSPH
jgi:hypothetical protein